MSWPRRRAALGSASAQNVRSSASISCCRRPSRVTSGTTFEAGLGCIVLALPSPPGPQHRDGAAQDVLRMRAGKRAFVALVDRLDSAATTTQLEDVIGPTGPR